MTQNTPGFASDLHISANWVIAGLILVAFTLLAVPHLSVVDNYQTRLLGAFGS
jgi:hypothetical protein